ncbi:MAG: class I SAM-dependent methyltransferase [Ferruginibacter sp.]
MLKTLEEVFELGTIETGSNGERIKLHSNTSIEQCLFLQGLYDEIKPKRSLEVGFAYGISTLFILEKCRQYNNDSKCHIVIEPFDWGNAAIHNISKEGLQNYIDIRKDRSDVVLPSMYLNNERIQFAYIDTTKVFDTVLQDFYFIDKIMDTGGVIIFDDCGGAWPGVQKVVRLISTLPHYKVLSGHEKIKPTFKKALAEKIISSVIKLVPFKKRFYPSYNFKTDGELGLNYSCVAFQKVSSDARQWDWDKPF